MLSTVGNYLDDPKSQNDGMLERQNAGMTECWNDGMLERQNTGMLEWRNMIPNAKMQNDGIWPQILKPRTTEYDPKS